MDISGGSTLSGKFTVRPCQILQGLKDAFPLKIGDFQGRTVNLPEAISSHEVLNQQGATLGHLSGIGRFRDPP